MRISRWKAATVVAAVAASLATTGVSWGAPAPVDGLPTSGSNTPTMEAPPCAPDEDPTVGCGLRIIGHNDIVGRANSFNLAKIGSCAYVTSAGRAEPGAATPAALAGPTDGVAVLDAHDPTNPQLVSILQPQGGVDSGETVSAVDAGTRKVLVVGAYGGRKTVDALDSTYGPALEIYDVSGDCTQPIHTATIYWPDNAHNLTLNPTATRVYGTRYAAEPKATAATAGNALLGLGPVLASSPVPVTDVMVMDITDLANPRFATELPLILPDGSPTECHKVEFDATETRMYCASDKLSSEAQPDGREPPYSVWPAAGPTIWDVSEISEGKPNPVAHFVGQSPVKGQGGHHAVPMTATDSKGQQRRYVVAANELAFTCDMAAYPRIWDITDEAHPTVVSELHLPASDNCSGNHYNNVDNRENTTMALVGWIDAGFRVFDVRDPVHPRPLAFFKPGSGCYSIAYLDEALGYIWFACEGGFYVADLAPAARASMDLPSRPPSAPTGLSSQAWSVRSTFAAAAPASGLGQAAVGVVCWLPATSAPRTISGP